MHLVQILLPLRDNDGLDYPHSMFQTLNRTLAETFGGVTAFIRAPASGVWINDDQPPQHDDVITMEVMTEKLNPAWWALFRARLERDLRQQEVVIRAHTIERL